MPCRSRFRFHFSSMVTAVALSSASFGVGVEETVGSPPHSFFPKHLCLPATPLP